MRNKFTNKEKKLLSYSALFFTLVLILWVIFAPNRGVFDMIRSHYEIKRLQAENNRLEGVNKELQEEINRLQNDPAYLEEMARKEYGMLKENEVIYIFKKKKK
ncbi:septum formation initiator family protein [Thermodesulfobacteriota bacterium]